MQLLPTQKGSFRLFKFAGVTVYLHWMWFLLAAYEVFGSQNRYNSLAWNAAELLAVFSTVLLHEFGHSLACRSVGGQADTIVLWPLGGVAYVNPPQRPGAMLWSIAAGPLVNVALLVPLTALIVWGRTQAWWGPENNIRMIIISLLAINVILLGFNLLPIYPLDGGKIVWSLLWFVLGRGKSLMISTVLGMVGVIGLVTLALTGKSRLFNAFFNVKEPSGLFFFILMMAFIANVCWRSLQQARLLIKIDRLPRRTGYSCPSCRAAPLLGPLWKCNHCGTAFDTFETRATCPSCDARFDTTRCTDCGNTSPIIMWGLVPPPTIPPVVAE